MNHSRHNSGLGFKCTLTSMSFRKYSFGSFALHSSALCRGNVRSEIPVVSWETKSLSFSIICINACVIEMIQQKVKRHGKSVYDEPGDEFICFSGQVKGRYSNKFWIKFTCGLCPAAALSSVSGISSSPGCRPAKIKQIWVFLISKPCSMYRTPSVLTMKQNSLQFNAYLMISTSN